MEPNVNIVAPTPDLDFYRDIPGTIRPSAFAPIDTHQVAVSGGPVMDSLPTDIRQTMVQETPTEVPVQPQLEFPSMFDDRNTVDLNTPNAIENQVQAPQQGNYETNTSMQSQLEGLKSREGNYDTVGDIGDGAGLSVGAYQFTEKSGSAQKLAKNLGITNYDRLTPGQRKVALSRVINTPRGRQAQDNLVMNKYFKPAQKAASSAGITDGKTIEFLVDTNVNGGMRNVINRAKNMKGGLTLANLKSARIARYQQLVKNNPKKNTKFLRGWLNRVNSF